MSDSDGLFAFIGLMCELSWIIVVFVAQIAAYICGLLYGCFERWNHERQSKRENRKAMEVKSAAQDGPETEHHEAPKGKPPGEVDSKIEPGPVVGSSTLPSTTSPETMV